MLFRSHLLKGYITLTPQGFDSTMWVRYVGKHSSLPLSIGHCFEFYAQYTPLTTLQGCPRIVDNVFRLAGSPLQTLEFLPQSARYIDLSWQEDLGLLRLLTVENCNRVNLEGSPEDKVNATKEIINKYLRKGWAAMVPCARELIRAGLKGNATL